MTGIVTCSKNLPGHKAPGEIILEIVSQGKVLGRQTFALTESWTEHLMTLEPADIPCWEDVTINVDCGYQVVSLNNLTFIGDDLKFSAMLGDYSVKGNPKHFTKPKAAKILPLL